MLKRLPVIGIVVVILACATSASAATIPGEYIVVLKDGVSEPTTAADHTKKGAAVFQHYRHAVNGYAAKLSASTLAAVRTDSRVRFVAPDEEVRADCPDSGPPQRVPCSVDRVDGDLSSTVSGNGTGSINVNVAVLDTGIDLTHPDLNVVGGKTCLPKQKGFDDPEGHGTHVAGTIGMRDNTIGRVGIAPATPLWAVRVLNQNGVGSTSNVVCGIDFITGTRFDADSTNDVAVANMSLGFKLSDDGNCGATRKDALHSAVCRAVAAGITIVASAGNETTDLRDNAPATYDEVLAATAIADFDGQPGGLGDPPCVQAVEKAEVDDTPASFSNFATLASDRAHTVAAPGVCVDSSYSRTPCIKDGVTIPCYAWVSGTSMAAPHVAGTVALCVASGPCAGLTPPQIIQKIVADAAAYNTANPSYGFTGDPLHSPDPNRYYGYLIRAGLY